MKNGLVLIGRTMPVLTRHARSHGRKTTVFIKGSFTYLNLFNSKRGTGGEKQIKEKCAFLCISIENNHSP